MSATAEATATGYRYIVKIPGTCGGRPIIEGTRIGVNDVVGLLQREETIDTIGVTCFPDITRAQVYECLAYYEDHRKEIDALIAEQCEPSEAIRREVAELNEAMRRRRAGA